MSYREQDYRKPLGCPRCKRELKLVDDQGMLVHHCAVCGGAWLGADAVQALLADCELPDLPPRSGATTISTKALLCCPVCAAEMRRRSFLDHSSVTVDECIDCGSWFDENELEVVVEYLNSAEGQRRLAMLRARPI